MARPAARYLEDQRGCDEADYAHAGRATAEEISAALTYLREQPFIRQDGAVIVGHSAGGWGALALAGADPAVVGTIVVFAPGRGGHANDFPNQVCAPHTLIASAAEFGQGARVPVTWLVAANDSYFSPDLSKKLADAFRRGGGKADVRRAGGIRQRGPLAGGNRGWRQNRRSRAGSRAEAARRDQEAMTLYFIVKYLHVLGAIVILGTGTGIAFFMLMAHRSRDVAFIARTGGHGRDRRHAVHADGGGAATRHRRAVDGAVGDRGDRALACDFARALRGRRAVLDSGGLHADRNARSGACGRGRAPAAAAALFRAVSPLVPVRHSRIRFGHDHSLADDRQAGF